MLELEFQSDKSFSVETAKTISIYILEKYSYSDDKLTLNLEDGAEMLFSYELKDKKKILILEPKSDFSYIAAKVEFTKE